MASSDIEPLLNSQPPNLPFNVARVTADGRPTQYMIDWESFSSNWFRSNIIKTDQRIDSVKAVADGAAAAVVTETNARISADEALATQITTVEAKANSATANGEIYFGAMAGPVGSVAAYGVFLKAGNTFAGMQILAESGGGASIGFAANDFRLTDSGTAQNVFNYTGGVFTFNVPVRVQTIDIAANAVTAVHTTGTDIVSTLGDTGGVWFDLLSLTVTGGAGYYAVVSADFEYKRNSGSGTVTSLIRLLKDGGTVLFSTNLGLFADYFTNSISRIDTNVPFTHTYKLQIFLSSTGTVSFDFRARNLVVDIRKR